MKRIRLPGTRAGLISFASPLLVLSSVMASAQESQSTEKPEEENAAIEEVVVQGMRMSLENAQDIKRHAPTVVDSITAKDLGSFPDKSVAEALQRVAGITVNRFAASSDTAHFSAEPSGVVVRGLNQVRNELNGRDSFSANSSRGLSWGDVSPELMGGVDTYKNQMAELVEGGIAGTVNLRTRVPFDQDDDLVAFTVSSNYGDLSGDVTPEASGLYSTRWQTGVGEFGVLANVAYSDVHTNTEGNQLFRMNRFRDVYEEDSLYYIPAGINMRETSYDRERQGGALAFQFQNLDETVVVTTQYNRSEYENAMEEYIVQASPADLSYSQSVLFEVDAGNSGIPRPAPGTEAFTFDSNGLFQQGTMVTGLGWWGGNDAEAMGYATNAAGQPLVNPCYDWAGCTPADQRGINMNTGTRYSINKNMTQDFATNVKWAITDRVRSQFDIQYVDSKVENYDIETGFASYADLALDLTGKRPAIQLLDPTNVNLSEGNWANPNNYRIHSIMDHVEDSEGDQLALRGDFEFDIDNGWMESIKTGVRWAERDQQVRWSGYNWQNVANDWTNNQSAYYNLDRHEPANGAGGQPGFTGYPLDFYGVRSLGTSNYHDINFNQFVFANMDLISNRQAMANALGAGALGLTGGVGWDPICSNTGDRSGEVEGTCFTPSEIADVNEETQAAYIQFNFGGSDAELFGVPVSGNFGLRYVKTINSADGGTDYARLGDEYFFTLDPETGERISDPTRQNLGCAPVTAPEGQPQPPIPFTLGCYLSMDDVAFMNGASQTGSSKKTHHNLLPSFNIKFDLTEEVLLRFAASKAMARPDIGNLRYYTGIGETLPDTDNPGDPLWVKNAEGEIVGANVRYTSGAQNPYLSPIEATQFDLALEYYFADVGSMTLTLFHKQFDNYIQIGNQNVEFTNNGVTRTVEVNRPLNGDGAEIKGFEFAFQRFFDFLPEPFNGLGVQANYTFIDNQGITNTGVQAQGAESTTVTAQAPDTISVNRLEGLSDNAYNLVGMYEYGDWQARLAYSWRDEYMVTAIDCCVAYPVWTEAFGSLDGSVAYSLTDNLDIAFQASNLLNEETVMTQQVSNVEDGGTRMPNSWFINDRRYTLGLRFQF
ncbi:TonB-dependent receptor [Microbulbifer bruguierae]|uniref:TonB-dependent receptor n=1 Tax=Microbulbifer bruguierae TaxID=3029061 RepID=A0ABY8NI51_9GAMM|nr:TonB-dependent receptor [Microbulbifer bruguierae]WGL18385.1 TonB-dependent receptor [Microbulbifer bruguierae]